MVKFNLNHNLIMHFFLSISFDILTLKLKKPLNWVFKKYFIIKLKIFLKVNFNLVNITTALTTTTTLTKTGQMINININSSENIIKHK